MIMCSAATVPSSHMDLCAETPDTQPGGGRGLCLQQLPPPFSPMCSTARHRPQQMVTECSHPLMSGKPPRHRDITTLIISGTPLT